MDLFRPLESVTGQAYSEMEISKMFNYMLDKAESFGMRDYFLFQTDRETMARWSSAARTDDDPFVPKTAEERDRLLVEASRPEHVSFDACTPSCTTYFVAHLSFICKFRLQVFFFNSS